MACEHEVAEFTVEMTMVEQEPEWRYAAVRARCAECKQLFHFRGIASGDPSPDEPMVSADGFELRTPIATGPGAVVGLLQKTGMLEHLVDPNGSSA